MQCVEMREVSVCLCQASQQRRSGATRHCIKAHACPGKQVKYPARQHCNSDQLVSRRKDDSEGLYREAQATNFEDWLRKTVGLRPTPGAGSNGRGPAQQAQPSPMPAYVDPSGTPFPAGTARSS